MAYLKDRYRRRVRAVGRETHRLRGDVAKVLVEGLRAGTQEQLYDRTPLEVTHAMMRSIRPIMQGQYGCAVGYNASVAPHAPFRVNMHGISVTGGHLLDMRMADYLRANANPRIRRLGVAAHRRMIEAK